MTDKLLMDACLPDKNGRLGLARVPCPALSDGEVLLRVHATAVNRADLLQRQGLYPPPPGASEILGLECAGVVVACGPGVSEWQEGDQVCALLAGGGYGEYVSIDARHCLPIPPGYSFAEAAALPEAFATAWLNLYQEARLQPGERVLLPAGASGVGTAAIQLCRVMGNPCFVSVGTTGKLARCLELGAKGGVVRGQQSLASLLKPEGVDVILDPVAGDCLAEHLALLRDNGRLVLIGFMGGREASLDLGRILVRRLRIIGSTLRSRSAGDKAELIGSLGMQVWPHFSQGALAPVIDSVFPWTEAEAAHARVAANLNIGKVVLQVTGN
ncbi:MAG: NAD(P)H-quinone oxidoreductase [Moraxellaceae bacterium]|nr:NAD(P)H-quinone oxidoreductase [Moraxellaceae bacterium]